MRQGKGNYGSQMGNKIMKDLGEIEKKVKVNDSGAQKSEADDSFMIMNGRESLIQQYPEFH